jgi:hypothetical protein
LGQPFIWGKSWRIKTNREYKQNLLRLFEAPCRLMGPMTATWRACDVILEMHHVGNWEEFSCIDNSLQCYNENEDCNDATVEQSVAKQQKTSEYQETDKDDTTERERVTNQDARIIIAGLRLYFMQEGNEGSPISALETCADFVQLQSIKRTRQSTRGQFLQRH